MIILNKVTKENSNMAWSANNMSITKKDEELFIATGVLRIHGNRAMFMGTPTLQDNFSADANGAYTVPAGQRIIGAEGTLADNVALLKVKSELQSAEQSASQVF